VIRSRNRGGWEQRCDRGPQRERTVLDQAQHGSGHERLRDARDPEGRAGLEWRAGGAVVAPDGQGDVDTRRVDGQRLAGDGRVVAQVGQHGRFESRPHRARVALGCPGRIPWNRGPRSRRRDESRDEGGDDPTPEGHPVGSTGPAGP
jgi:hypothetical protein